MGRPPSDDPRDRHITVRLNDAERAVLDRKRGAMEVGAFIRKLITKTRAGGEA